MFNYNPLWVEGFQIKPQIRCKLVPHLCTLPLNSRNQKRVFKMLWFCNKILPMLSSLYWKKCLIQLAIACNPTHKPIPRRIIGYHNSFGAYFRGFQFYLREEHVPTDVEPSLYILFSGLSYSGTSVMSYASVTYALEIQAVSTPFQGN